MASRLTLRVHDRLARLTASERKLAELLLERPDCIDTHSATELAGLAGVSKATAARFFRSLGYRDFDEVKTQAREERDRTAPYRYSLTTSEAMAHGRAIGDHLDLDQLNLRRTFEEMPSDRLARAVDRLQQAPRLWCFGHGLESALARYARTLFARLRPDVMRLVDDGSVGVEDLAMAGPRDVLLLFTVVPRPRMLRNVLDYLGTARTDVVAVCDHAFLPRAERHGALALPCHVAGYGGMPSHTAMYSLLRLLAVSLSSAEPTAAERRALVDQIHDELDDLE